TRTARTRRATALITVTKMPVPTATTTTVTAIRPASTDPHPAPSRLLRDRRRVTAIIRPSCRTSDHVAGHPRMPDHGSGANCSHELYPRRAASAARDTGQLAR